MIRLIVTSATYRQSSRHRPELRRSDPQNRLLARQNRFRVEAEIVRDLHLAAGGLLTPRSAGRASSRRIARGSREDHASAASCRGTRAQGADRYRRGLYTCFQRTCPYPI